MPSDLRKVIKNSFFSSSKIICRPVEEDLPGCHLIILLKSLLDEEAVNETESHESSSEDF